MRMWKPGLSREERCTPAGFALIETLIATLILAIGVQAVAYLAFAAARVQAASRQSVLAIQLARDKMEQLRALAFTSDAAIVPVTDLSSDVSAEEPTPSSGRGLGLSPPGSLATNAQGFCDFLDAQGRWLGAGSTPPPGTVWVRRWSIAPLSAPADTLALTVIVSPAAASNDDGVRLGRDRNGARLLSIRTRRAR